MKPDSHGKIKLYDYTLGEELTSSISHGAGMLFGVAALVLCVLKAQGDGFLAVFCAAVYGVSMILMYSASTLYHALRPNKAKRVFRVLDHCAIYLLIAGSYTPFTLLSLKGTLGWVIFAAVWVVAAAAITLNAVNLEKFKVFSMVCYIALGWAIIVAIKPITEALGPDGTALLIAGGLMYTVGAIIYGLGKRIRYMHSIWHFFVLAGSVLHFLAIYSHCL